MAILFPVMAESLLLLWPKMYRRPEGDAVLERKEAAVPVHQARRLHPHGHAARGFPGAHPDVCVRPSPHWGDVRKWTRVRDCRHTRFTARGSCRMR